MEAAAPNEREEEDDYLVKRNILLRDYQMKLLEKAKRGNSIIYLPTGAGKTLIAIHVLCSRSNDIRRPYMDGGKRAFFLTPTKVMVNQIAKAIRNHTKFNVVPLTGDMNVDCWSRTKWELLFETNHVFVLTGQILRTILYLKIITPAKISLLVFDECHHATNEHPYHLVAKAINQSKSDEKPLILGLSSVLLKTTPKVCQVEKHVNHLEKSLNAKVITESNLEEVWSFSANPADKILVYCKEEPTRATNTYLNMYDNLIETLGKMLLIAQEYSKIPNTGHDFKDRNKARRLKNYVVKAKHVFEELGFFGGSLGLLFYIIHFEKIRLLSNNSVEIQTLIFCRTQLLKLRFSLQRYVGENETVDSIIKYSSNKVKQLITALKNIYESERGKHLTTIIFVQQRVFAICVSFLLKRLSAMGTEYNFLKPDFVVGTSNFSKESLFLENKNEEIVRKLAARSINVLVTTNLLEEGVDISACNVVISFDFPQGYPSYFQSRGRARNNESIYIMFAEKAGLEAKKKAWDLFKSIEAKVVQTVARTGSEFGERNEEREEEVESVVLDGRIKVDGLLAILAVQRYCCKLPQDKHTFLSPISWYTGDDLKKAFVQLPMNCPLRTVIEGEPRGTKKEAKRSAFLLALKKLYDMGELNDDLNPKNQEVNEEDYCYLFPHYKKEVMETDTPLPGTTRRKQKYKMKFAECLSGCLPTPGVPVYLHVLNFVVTFEKPTVDRKISVYETLTSPVTFALLSAKKLTKIFKFPLFLDIGQIDCDLLVNYDELILTESEISDIKECHFSVFKKIARVMKSSHIFDNRNKEHSFFVVPVEKNEEGRFVLNWDLIRTDFCKMNSSALVKFKPNPQRVMEREFARWNLFSEATPGTSNALVRMDVIHGQDVWGSYGGGYAEPNFEVTENDYKYFVIFPNYRNQEFPQLYIVNKFCSDMSPMSPFPRTEYEDYIDYYKKNYSVMITNEKQPLLRVSPIFECANFNKPRIKKFAKEKDKNYEEHLIPELCDVIPFDRRFFLKALLLPTALNRIYHVYCVDEFRRKIFAESGLGVDNLPPGMEWARMNVQINKEKAQQSSTKSFELTLPLTKLKDQTVKINPDVLDPERRMYKVGLCDLEFYVGALKDSSWAEAEEMKENVEVQKLLELRNTAIPPLNIIQKNKEATASTLVYLVEACTGKAANDGLNYERLEILGDSVLKFATTLFLFRNFPANEGILTALKGKILGNRNLLYCALAKNFPDVINVSDFAPLCDWSPPLTCISEELAQDILDKQLDPAVIYQFDIPLKEQFSGVLSMETLRKNREIINGYEKYFNLTSNYLFSYKIISDKTISDCVEAFIAAYLLITGMRGAFDFLLWLQVLPAPEGSYAELLEKPLSPHKVKDGKVLEILSQVYYTELEETLNYCFNDKALLLEAITHPSFFKNRITDCYQRLEFLGDAILDFLITSYVYEYCGNLSPGQVTDIRSSLVNNITFACLTVRYELHKYLLSFSSSLLADINNFVSFQASRNHVVDDNVLILMEEDDYSIAETIQVPKALGDIFESLAGAIFLDSGNSLEAVWRVYYVLMKRELDEFTKTVPKTPVRLLCEICGDKPFFESKVVQNGVVMVSCLVYFDNKEIKSYGFGTNVKNAKRSASKIALNKILALRK